MSQHRKQSPSSRRKMIVEQLEMRSVLSGFFFGGAVHAPPPEHVFVHNTSPALSAAAVQFNVPIQSGSAALQTTTTSPEVHLSGTLSSISGTGTATGKVSYESETEHGAAHTKLVVSVSGATPGNPLDVKVTDSSGATTTVGTITPDASGNGKLSISASVPTLIAGSVVTVGTDLTTTLATATNTGGGEHCGGGESGGSEGTETRLTTALTDSTPNSTLTGSATFKTEQENGATVSSLKVKVTGATANTTLPVAIDGTSVGSITTDANGNGTLFLTSNATDPTKLLPAGLTVNAGSVVTVGTATGTLATPTPQSGQLRAHARKH